MGEVLKYDRERECYLKFLTMQRGFDIGKDDYVAHNGIVEQSELSEVQLFTDFKVAVEMLNELPIDIWNDPDIKFLNVCSKTGVFEYLIYTKLMVYLADKIPDERKRREHILYNQIYGLTINEVFKGSIAYILTGFGRSNYDNIVVVDNYITNLSKGNLKNVVQGAFGKDMKFDVILGNPPYQITTDAGKTVKMAIPIYNKFIEQAIELNPTYISMIVPSKWMVGGIRVLDDFRRRLIEEKHLSVIHHFKNAGDVFNNVDIAGGVCYFLWNKDKKSNEVVFYNYDNDGRNVAIRDIDKYRYLDRNGNMQYMIVSDNLAEKIVSKVYSFGEETMDKIVSSINPFGLDSNFEDSREKTLNKQIKVVCSNRRVEFTSRGRIVRGVEILYKYKVLINSLTSEHGGNNPSGKQRVISGLQVAKPNEACTSTFLVAGYSETREEADRIKAYLKTKFVRFLIKAALLGIHITSRNFVFVPIQDFSINWTDEMLYKKYKLTEEEIDYIEKTMTLIK